uniref:Uncharacterized protein n=1 Tax=Anopheles quadriannulatus TaxID=34691 RepID=A0A182XTZ3_ANOQN
MKARSAQNKLKQELFSPLLLLLRQYLLQFDFISLCFWKLSLMSDLFSDRTLLYFTFWLLQHV